MASYRSFAVLTAVLSFALASLLHVFPSALTGSPGYDRLSLFDVVPASFAVDASDELALQSAIRASYSPVEVGLNGILRSIDIRSSLEDTARLRGELG